MLFEVGCVIDIATGNMTPIYKNVSPEVVEKFNKKVTDFLIQRGIEKINELGFDRVNEILNKPTRNELNKKSKIGR